MKNQKTSSWLGEHNQLAVNWLWKQLLNKNINVSELESEFAQAVKMQEDQMWNYALYVVKEWQEQSPDLRLK
jgi:hypothetical protein